jgi:hypothetical protein
MTNILWIWDGLPQYLSDVQVLDIMLVIRIIQIISNSWICFGSETHQTNIPRLSNSGISTLHLVLYPDTGN